jgi:hypothetical protein
MRNPILESKNSCLTRKCELRGTAPKTTGPSMMPTWLEAMITGPSAGTFSAPCTVVLHQMWLRNRPTCRAHTGPQR